MKKLLISFSVLALTTLSAVGELVYHEASQFKIIGKATEATKNVYNRLPDSLETKIRSELWELGRNNAGIAVRFRSDAVEIGAKWKVWMVRNMNHMTPTGIRGLDLYCLQDDGSWLFVNSGRPSVKAKSEATFMKNMTRKMREYMLYLPLYDGIDSLEIGVDSLATILQPVANVPVEEKPIVWYGTSILQGGCANRPGMAGSNIIERRLNREIINLGFSGNGRLDPEVAEVIASVDASMYIMDMVPNNTAEQLKEKIEKFYIILRNARPNIPILLVENPQFPNMNFSTEVNSQVRAKNVVLKDFYDKLRKAGDKNVHFVSSDGMIGYDAEATVDCYHFTDLGFMRFADYMTPILQQFLKK